MRRTDREVTDRSELLEIVERCDVCRLAMNTPDGYPYVLPLNFGYEEKDGVLTLYFHSAMTGTKNTLLEADPRVSFEMDCRHRLSANWETGSCTMKYGCVMGRGTVEFLTDPEEKRAALRLLCDHYHREASFPINEQSMARTTVYRVTATDVTAKANR